MNITRARETAAMILYGNYHLITADQCREAAEILRLNALLFTDARPDHGAAMVCDFGVDYLTNFTVPLS